MEGVLKKRDSSMDIEHHAHHKALGVFHHWSCLIHACARQKPETNPRRILAFSLTGFHFLGLLTRNVVPHAHYGPKQPRIQTEVLGHSLVCLFVRSHHSLASLAPSAALTRSLARSLRSLPRSWDSDILDGYFVCVFSPFSTIVKRGEIC